MDGSAVLHDVRVAASNAAGARRRPTAVDSLGRLHHGGCTAALVADDGRRCVTGDGVGAVRLFDLRRSHPWPANISIQALPGDGIAIVLSQGKGCNVIDVDSNRYVDLAGGFGSLLLGGWMGCSW